MISWIWIPIRVKSWIRASMKHVQATGEAFSPQKRTSSTSKYKIPFPLSNFVCQFCSPGSGSSWWQNHCGSGSTTPQKFLSHFLILCVSFVLLDPDPADGKITADQDPQHHKNVTFETNIRLCVCLLISCLLFLRGGGAPSRIFPLQFCTVWNYYL